MTKNLTEIEEFDKEDFKSEPTTISKKSIPKPSDNKEEKLKPSNNKEEKLKPSDNRIVKCNSDIVKALFELQDKINYCAVSRFSERRQEFATEISRILKMVWW